MGKFSVYLNRHVFVMKCSCSRLSWALPWYPANKHCEVWLNAKRLWRFEFFVSRYVMHIIVPVDVSRDITKTRLFKYIENFTTKKDENFQIKNLIFFIFLLKNIGCGYSFEPPQRGGSNEYPQSMLLSRNKKNNVYPCKPQFYYIKVGFKGVKIK